MLFRKVPNSPGSSSHILKSLLTEEGILWFSDKREKITYKVEAGCFFLSDSNVRTSNVHKTMLTHLFLCNLIWKMNFHPQYSQLGASVMWLWRPQLCFLGLLVLKVQAWCFINIISPIQFVSGLVYLCQTSNHWRDGVSIKNYSLPSAWLLFPSLAAVHRDEWWEVGETGRNKELLAWVRFSKVTWWGPWVLFAPPAANPAGQV